MVSHPTTPIGVKHSALLKSHGDDLIDSFILHDPLLNFFLSFYRPCHIMITQTGYYTRGIIYKGAKSTLLTLPIPAVLLIPVLNR